MWHCAASDIIDLWSCALQTTQHAQDLVNEPPPNDSIDLSYVRVPELVSRVLGKEGIDTTSKELLSVLSTLMRAPVSRDGADSDGLISSLINECEQRGVGPEARLLVSICTIDDI